ncbi:MULTISPECIES: autotransporter outer membrane beta-barrel domain-containing protein [Bradyrhizobium]|uniref:autotransporter outer membrane beta-barrel domain-containing protein n=1 Tax=Bradyrhizobium TaxID=374 RepID=UPI0003F5DC62|nr:MULTISPECIES: autotransporter outer membrane beta-barrel domain-containing protein [Bradyrhizobium]QOG20523.1 autotransporter domain-containing protein [Bradyrhizobium sp. SEMIA]UFW45355.1 autotransporter outer membrane beta-barrel domain-containing protein [Bradyrhizobium arachidis]
MSIDVRARLALLLLTAGLLLPRAADAQVMREFGAFGATENFGSGPNGPANVVNFNIVSNAGVGMGGPMYMSGPMYMGGAMYGGPQLISGGGGAPLGNGNGGGGMPPNYVGSADPAGVSTARFGMLQVFRAGSNGNAAQTETAQATFLAMTQFTQTLLDPAIDGRGIGPAELDAELAAYAEIGNDRTHGGIGREAYAATYGKPSLSAPHWSVWAAGFGGSQVSTAGSGSASRSFGTVVGADYSLSPQTRMGFALAGGGTGFVNNFSSGRSDLFQAGTFVRHSVGSAYVATALAYGWQAITGDYQVTPAGTDQASAATNANAYSGRIESGYRFATPWLGITPYAAGQFTMFRLAANANQSAYMVDGSATSSGSDSFTDTRSELGLRASTSFVVAGGLLDLRGRLAWAHDFSAARSMPAVFQAVSSQGLIAGTTAFAVAPNSALSGVSLELRDMKGWSASANVDSELSSLVRSYTGRAVLRYVW